MSVSDSRRWMIVPLEPDDRMCGSIEYGAASLICETRIGDRRYFLRKAIQASPGAPLMQEILARRDAVVTAIGEGQEVPLEALLESLAKLGSAEGG